MAFLRVRGVAASASRKLFYCKNIVKMILTGAPGLFSKVGCLSEVAVLTCLTVIAI